MTNPERFAPLHDAADDVVADLQARYRVQVDHDPSDDRFADFEVVRTLRMVGDREDSAALGIGWTSFPGVVLAMGRWASQVFPECGCDACGDDVHMLVDESAATAHAVVGGGWTVRGCDWLVATSPGPAPGTVRWEHQAPLGAA